MFQICENLKFRKKYFRNVCFGGVRFVSVCFGLFRFVLVAIGLFRFETDFRVPEKIFGEYFCRERFSILFSASIMVKTFFLTFQAKV